MNEIAKQYASDLFSCFQTQDPYELNWIEVTSDTIKAYCGEMIVYEFDHHNAKGVCYFHIHSISEPKLAWTGVMLRNYLYELHGNEFRKFIDCLSDYGVIWTV